MFTSLNCLVYNIRSCIYIGFKTTLTTGEHFTTINRISISFQSMRSLPLQATPKRSSTRRSLNLVDLQLWSPYPFYQHTAKATIAVVSLADPSLERSRGFGVGTSSSVPWQNNEKSQILFGSSKAKPDSQKEAATTALYGIVHHQADSQRFMKSQRVLFFGCLVPKKALFCRFSCRLWGFAEDFQEQVCSGGSTGQGSSTCRSWSWTAGWSTWNPTRGGGKLSWNKTKYRKSSELAVWDTVFEACLDWIWDSSSKFDARHHWFITG